MTIPKTRISDLIVRIQDEFLEADAPLTVGELQHRVKTDDIACRAVLGALIDAGVLVRIDDLYWAPWEGCVARIHRRSLSQPQ